MSEIKFSQLWLHLLNLTLHIEQIYSILCLWLHLRILSRYMGALVIDPGRSYLFHKEQPSALKLITFVGLLLDHFLSRSHCRLAFAQTLKLHRAVLWNPKFAGELFHLQAHIQLPGIVILDIIHGQLLTDLKHICFTLLCYIENVFCYGMIGLCQVWPLSSGSHHLVHHLGHIIYISVNTFKLRLLHSFVVFVSICLFYCVEFLFLL